MSNIYRMSEDLKQQEKTFAEQHTIFEEETTLTPEQQKAYDELQQKGSETFLVVNDTDAAGNTVEIPVDDFLADVGTTTVEDPNGENIRLMNTEKSDLQEIEEIKEKETNRIYDTMRTLARGNKELSDDEIAVIMQDTMESIKKKYNLTSISNAFIQNRFSKKPLAEIMRVLPRSFLEMYLSPDEIVHPTMDTKDTLVAAVNYAIVSGPDMDDLNEFIDKENRIIMLSKQLLQYQVDFQELIKNPDELSKFLEEARKYHTPVSPEDDTWAQHIKNPDRLHNEFAQRCAVMDRYATAYQSVMEEYEDTPENQEVRKAIQVEIDHCMERKAVYQDICELALLPKLWYPTLERYQNNKKCTMKYLIKEAVDAVTRIRKAKIQVPFPGYDGTSKDSEKIFTTYMAYMNATMVKYNEEIQKILDTVQDADKSIDHLIAIPGYKTSSVITMFSMLVVILMGRVMKHLSKHNAENPKRDAILLHSYFTIFCKMATDVYIMEDIWAMMRSGVEWAVNSLYLPAIRDQ